MNYLTHALRSAPALIFLSLLFVWAQFNTATVYLSSFHRAYNAKEPLTLSFTVAFTFVCIFLLPLLINRLSFKEPLRDLGLAWPQHFKKTLLLMLAILPLLLLPSFYLAQQKSIRFFYSLSALSPAQIAFTFLLAYPPYYLAEEFFFRGFLFLRLQRQLGWHSYWITEVIFTWAHIGKPPLEILFSFPAGLALNYLTARSKSIYPAMVVHFILGVALLTWVTYPNSMGSTSTAQ